MLNRNLVITAAMILGAVSMPAQARVDIDIRIVPPAPRLEVAIPSPIGYVWVPGSWRREGHRHVWNNGHWMREQPRPTWSREQWSRHGDGFDSGRRGQSDGRDRVSNRQDGRDGSGPGDRGRGGTRG